MATDRCVGYGWRGQPCRARTRFVLRSLRRDEGGKETIAATGVGACERHLAQVIRMLAPPPGRALVAPVRQ